MNPKQNPNMQAEASLKVLRAVSIELRKVRVIFCMGACGRWLCLGFVVAHEGVQESGSTG